MMNEGNLSREVTSPTSPSHHPIDSAFTLKTRPSSATATALASCTSSESTGITKTTCETISPSNTDSGVTVSTTIATNEIAPSDSSPTTTGRINSVSSNHSSSGNLTSGNFASSSNNPHLRNASSSHYSLNHHPPHPHHHQQYPHHSPSASSHTHSNHSHPFHTTNYSTSKYHKGNSMASSVPGTNLNHHSHHSQQQQQQQQQQLQQLQDQQQQGQHNSHTHNSETGQHQGASATSSNNFSYLINIPGINLPLSANDPSIRTIKQHYYPEGAWGWVILSVASFVHFITAALTPTSGLLVLEVMNYFSPDQGIVSAVFLGALSTCVTLLSSPILIAICKKKSLRLTAILGGLITALGCLFTSFATQFHQLFFSMSIFMAIGTAMIHIPAVMIVGSYFKKKRAIVEIAIHCSQGLGLAFMPLFLTFCIRIKSWRFGFQCMALVIVVAFFVAILYRPASLYHPQRRAILHLKSLQKRSRLKDEHLKMQAQSSIGSGGTTGTLTGHGNHGHLGHSQRLHSTSSAGVSSHANKVTDKSMGIGFEKACYFDFSVLKSRTVQIILSGTCISYFGMTGPIFLMALMGKSDGLDYASLMRLQIFLGLGSILGVLVFGLIIVKNSVQCLISRQYLCQSSCLILAISSLAFTGFNDYSGYVLFSWLYGFFYGGYQYSLKMFIFDKVRARNFNRAWGFLQVSQSLPLLFGMPIIMFLNDHFSSKIGFYLSSACLALGSIVFFLIDAHKASKSRHNKHHSDHHYSVHKEQPTFEVVPGDHNTVLTGGQVNGVVTNSHDALVNGVNLLTINDINSIYHSQNPLFRRSSSSSGSINAATCRAVDGLMSNQARILRNYLKSLTNDSSRSLGASLEPSSTNSTLTGSVGKVSPCRLNNLSNSVPPAGVSGGFKISCGRSSRSNSLDPAICELTCISEEANFLDDLNDMWESAVDSNGGQMDGKISVNGKGKKNLTSKAIAPSLPATGPSGGTLVEAVYANSSSGSGSNQRTESTVEAKKEPARQSEKQRSKERKEDADEAQEYDEEESDDETSHFLMLIERRKQQLLQAAASASTVSPFNSGVSPVKSNITTTSTSTATTTGNNSSNEGDILNDVHGGSHGALHGGRKIIHQRNCPMAKKSSDCSGGSASITTCMPSCSSATVTNNATGSKRCACCGRLVVSDVESKCESPKHKTNSSGKCEPSTGKGLHSPIEASTEVVKSKQKSKKKAGKKNKCVKVKETCSDEEEDEVDDVYDDEDEIFTSGGGIILEGSSSEEADDEEIRKIMCAKKLSEKTKSPDSLYKKGSNGCESFSDDEDDDEDEDVGMPISLGRSESTAYKQEDTTIVYFTHRRDQSDKSISPQLNLQSSDLTTQQRNSPVLTSTGP